MLHNRIAEIITASTAENGFLATFERGDNYDRVWSRDSAMLSLAILLSGLPEHHFAIRKTVVSLMKYQADSGVIPSNIPAVSNPSQKVSYGSLVGRVDATTWWIIQSMAYVMITKDEEVRDLLEHPIRKAHAVLNAWEFNERHLIYTPVGGNWADEYVSNGYTLYDNLLRYWALLLTYKVYGGEKCLAGLKSVESAIHTNFNPQTGVNEQTLHPRVKSQLKTNTYWPSSFGPMGYDERWDMAANALALLLGFNKNTLADKNADFFSEYGHWMIPVFHPVITKSDPDWRYLAENYNYHFKNDPDHFHNGGSWPVMLGWYCLGLAVSGQEKDALSIRNNYQQLLETTDKEQFSEYFNPRTKVFGGMKNMCFSVSGWLFTQQIENRSPDLKQLISAV